MNLAYPPVLNLSVTFIFLFLVHVVVLWSESYCYSLVYSLAVP